MRTPPPPAARSRRRVAVACVLVIGAALSACGTGERPPLRQVDGHGHDGGGSDPHLWSDPLTLAEGMPALADAIGTAIGADLSGGLAAVQRELREVDAEVRTTMAAVPIGDCRLVSGHDSLGYFADRYGCTLVGAVIPSLSSTAETSAKDLAALVELAREQQVRAIFTETGTPTRIAEQVASSVGVPLVELPSHRLPDTGGYRAYMAELATGIANGVTGTG